MINEITIQTLSPESLKDLEIRTALKTKVANYSALTIKGQSDKIGYKNVTKAWQELKNNRIDIQKNFKASRDILNVIIKDNLADEKKLISDIEPVELLLKEQLNNYDKEADRLKQLSIDMENKRIQDRIDLLAKYGETMPYVSIQAMTDDNFSIHLEASKNKFEASIKLQQEQERLAKEEADKIAEQVKENAKLIKEKEALSKKLNDITFKMREKELLALGFIKDGEYYKLDAHTITIGSLIDNADDDFEEYVSNIKTYLDTRPAIDEKFKENIEQATKDLIDKSTQTFQGVTANTTDKGSNVVVQSLPFVSSPSTYTTGRVPFVSDRFVTDNNTSITFGETKPFLIATNKTTTNEDLDKGSLKSYLLHLELVPDMQFFTKEYQDAFNLAQAEINKGIEILKLKINGN